MINIIEGVHIKNRHRTFFLVCLLLLTVFAKTDIDSEYNVPIGANSVFAADCDLDGYNDLVVGHNTTWGDSNISISLLHNSGIGPLEITDTSKSFCGNQWSILSVDLNSDGYPEIVAVYSDFSTGVMKRFIRIYYNSTGQYPNSNYIDFALNTSESIVYVSHGDINGDGFTDLVFISHYGQFWGVLYNDGAGYFPSPEYHSVPGLYPLSVVCGDLNNDSRDDIAISGQNIKLILSFPSGFQEISINTLSKDVKIADFDGDGYQDILGFSPVMGYPYTVFLAIKNNGDNTFTQLTNEFIPVVTHNIACSDLNNDGLPEMLFQLEDYSGYEIYYNQGGFLLVDSQFVSVPSYGEGLRNCICADLDNNAFNDIITVRLSYVDIQHNIDIQFNDGHGNFSPNPIVGIGTANGVPGVLLKNNPNPFNEITTFNFNMKETALAELVIYTLQGNFISCLINQKISSGSHNIKWNGLDNFGNPCPAGLYMAVLKINGHVDRTIKIIKM
jgi:hypothetical protein